jgi:hypothetical protein
MGTFIFVTYIIVVLIALPCMTIWGWIRWWRAKKPRSLPYWLSLAGFSSATLSELVAIFWIAYSHTVGGVSFADSRPARIYGATFVCSGLLSVSGLIFALGGIWRKNPLRWHSVICAVGMVVFWIGIATTG